MGKSESQKSDNKKKKLLKEYLEGLKDIKTISAERSELLNKTHWEFENHNIQVYENIDSLISKYISITHKAYPSSFLGSSLGFTKMNYDSRYTAILEKYHLERKPQVPSPRNCLSYEILKLLLMKLPDNKNTTK